MFAVSACLVLSGFAALVYQIAWLRQFSIVFGTSDIAVAVVLSAYMGGLATGAAVVTPYLDRIRRPVLVYGLLEAGIAVSALAIPYWLVLTDLVQIALLGHQPEPVAAEGSGQVLFYLLTSLVIMLVPTGFMGATLPLLMQHVVSKDEQVGARIGLLYSGNTAGAVAGAVVAAYWLLPSLGLNGTILVGVVANLLVFAIAAGLSMRVPATGRTDPTARPVPTGTDRLVTTRHRWQRSHWILPLIGLSGAASFIYEVLWTRILTHFLGGSIYAFGAMLASFLTGITLGAAIASRFARDRRRACVSFSLAQLATALCSMATYAWLQWTPAGTFGLAPMSIFVVAAMLPSTLCIGASFPLAVRVLADDERNAGKSTGRVYAWNTVGAIVGALSAGFVLIPTLGFEGSVRLAVLLNIGIGLFAAASILNRPRVPAALIAAAFVAAIVLYRPGVPLTAINASVIDTTGGGSTIYYGVGRSATVLMKEVKGSFYLRSNGLPESYIAPRGAPPALHTQAWLGALPVAARPEARSMLLVGFGGGVAIAGTPATVRSIDVIELEPLILDANEAIRHRRAVDPLADPRVRIVVNDARSALKLTDKRYDILVSQPSHPWTAGASHLYTREFMQLASARLEPGGVFLQWISAAYVDAALLKSLAATLRSVFGHVRLYQPSASVLFFLASDAPLDVETEMLKTGRPLRESWQHYSGIGINAVEDLVVALALDAAGVAALAEGGRLITDDDNRMATHSLPRGDGLDQAGLFALLSEHDPLLDRDGWIHRYPETGLSLPYIASRLMASKRQRRAMALAGVVPDRASALLITGINARYLGERDKAEQYFRLAIAADPANVKARYSLAKLYLGRLASGTAPSDVQALVSTLPATAAAVVEGWQFGARRDWPALSRLDGALARSNPTELWYPDTVALRADWRTKVTSKRHGRELAEQALKLSDRGLTVSRELDLYVVRAAAALALREPEIFVETSAYIAAHVGQKLERAKAGELTIGDEELRNMLARTGGIARMLETGFTTPVEHRAAEVSDQLAMVMPLLRLAVED